MLWLVLFAAGSLCKKLETKTYSFDSEVVAAVGDRYYQWYCPIVYTLIYCVFCTFGAVNDIRVSIPPLWKHIVLIRTVWKRL